ncbi:MAG: hypothetical protein OIF51_04305 [Cellvibrionaceae bacterium]|nr:hypothetical protein [Cellvibrionaceae bacterium]
MPASPSPKRPWPLISRIFAALLGGYVFTNVCSMLLFFALVDKELIATASDDINVLAIASVFNSMTTIGLSSFLIYSAAAIWVFHCDSAKLAWSSLMLPSLAGLCLIYLQLPPAIQGLLSP